MENDQQRELFNWQWPPANQYSLNNERGIVKKWVQQDSGASSNFLILTGFGSLEYLIEEFGKEEVWKDRSIEIVLGNEPIIREEIIKKASVIKNIVFLIILPITG